MENQNSSFGNYSFSTALALIFSKTSAIKSSILDSNLRPSQNKNHKKLSHLPSSKIWFLSCRKWKWWWTYYRPLSIYRENNVQDTQPHLKWPNTGRGWGSYSTINLTKMWPLFHQQGQEGDNFPTLATTWNTKGFILDSSWEHSNICGHKSHFWSHVGWNFK